MTVKETRKIIGIKSKHLSDEEIERDIQVAEVLKDLFFNMLITHNVSDNNTSKLLPNVP